MSVTIEPVDPSVYYSTYLNNRISDFEKLSERIAMSLGYPQINIEAHTTQVYDNIALACEMFTKFAGYTKEYLVFHSSLYEFNKGLPMAKLISNTPELGDEVTDAVHSVSSPISTTDIKMLNEDRTIYTYTVETDTTGPVEYLLQFKNDYYQHATKFIITAIYNDITDEVDASVAEYGTTYTSTDAKVTFAVKTGGDAVEIVVNATEKGIATVTISDYKSSMATSLTTYTRGMDNLLGTYRKVVDCFAFEEGSTAGINTLFTIEQTLAQQTYFSYAMGKHGFDLVSWYVLKEWLSMREKMLQQKFHFKFNERDQRLYVTPQPVREMQRAEFYGIVGCYLEKPLKDIIKEIWVYQYAQALTKITIGRIRGKYQGTTLFGSGDPNYTELLQEGLADKEKLEEGMMTGTSPGFGDAEPPMFFVG